MKLCSFRCADCNCVPCSDCNCVPSEFRCSDCNELLPEYCLQSTLQTIRAEPQFIFPLYKQKPPLGDFSSSTTKPLKYSKSVRSKNLTMMQYIHSPDISYSLVLTLHFHTYEYHHQNQFQYLGHHQNQRCHFPVLSNPRNRPIDKVL